MFISSPVLHLLLVPDLLELVIAEITKCKFEKCLHSKEHKSGFTDWQGKHAKTNHQQ